MDSAKRAEHPHTVTCRRRGHETLTFPPPRRARRSRRPGAATLNPEITAQSCATPKTLDCRATGVSGLTTSGVFLESERRVPRGSRWNQPAAVIPSLIFLFIFLCFRQSWTKLAETSWLRPKPRETRRSDCMDSAQTQPRFSHPESISLAPGFSRVSANESSIQPLQRFPRRTKPLKRLSFCCRRDTRLKPGANETGRRKKFREHSRGLRAAAGAAHTAALPKHPPKSRSRYTPASPPRRARRACRRRRSRSCPAR